MPVYEYECPKCGVSERTHGMNDPDVTTCECGQSLTRLISRVPFVLKEGGSCGWSRDGYISSGEQPKQIDE